ncbi:hypothetical protein [Clostridium sp. Marseille-P2415]|nr:hypothetical protein [Clostridium sp. Marseille-P2415]
MKKTIALLLAASMLAISLTGCRTTARKQIKPLFFHVSAVTMEL